MVPNTDLSLPWTTILSTKILTTLVLLEHMGPLGRLGLSIARRKREEGQVN